MDYWRNGDDQIVDIVAGKNYVTVITAAGKIYNNGYVAYRYIDSNERFNIENYEDYPHEIKLPEGATNPKVWSCTKRYIWFVSMDLDGKRQTFVYGQYDDSNAGTRDGGYSYARRLMDSLGDRHLVQMNSTYCLQAGCDNEGGLWMWGSCLAEWYTFQDDDADIPWTEETNNSSVMKQVRHFKEKGYKAIEAYPFAFDKKGVIVKAKNEEGQLRMYYIRKKEDSLSPDGQILDKKTIETLEWESEWVAHITAWDATTITSFGTTYESLAFVRQLPAEKSASIIPDKPDEQGLIHFYRDNGAWVFVTESEYEEKKAELPRLVFATRHSIKDFSDKEWPDLDALAAGLGEAAEHSVDDNGNKIDAAGPLYCAYSEDGDETKRLHSSEKGALSGGHRAELDPVIFYRVASPCPSESLETLPSFKVANYFERENHADDKASNIKFMIRKKKFTEKDLEIELEDPQVDQWLKDLFSFTKDEDQELLSEIEK